jgi:hypothetical protein
MRYPMTANVTDHRRRGDTSDASAGGGWVRVLPVVVLGLWTWGLAACTATRDDGIPGGGIGSVGHTDGSSGDDAGGHDEEPATAAPAERTGLRQLTQRQYVNTVHALLGDDAPVPADLQLDLALDLYDTIGGAQQTASELGVERLEAAAAEFAAFALAAERRAAHVPCDPGSPSCVRDVAADFGRRAFRRPLSAEELDDLAALCDDVAVLRSDPWQGLEAMLTGILMSPSFLYLVELGEPDPDDPERGRYTSLEMASRLSYALWNGPPDDALLELGERGELVDPTVVRSEVDRMLADARTRDGLGWFFAQWLGLRALEVTTKDASLFPDADPELFAAMQGEARRVIEGVVFDQRRPVTDLLDFDTSAVDARLAALYGVAAPATVDGEGFGEVQLEGGRRGLLGTGAFLATQSRRTRTSPTLRGRWIQERLRCVEPPPPPADAEMELPDAVTEGDQTLRELLEEHRANPACASCHAMMDPLGLALEHFDALGRLRTTEAGQPIDATTQFEGHDLDGLAGVVEMLESDPAVSACVVRQLYRYTTGHREHEGEDPALEHLITRFEDLDRDLVGFVPDLLDSRAFRTFAR